LNGKEEKEHSKYIPKNSEKLQKNLWVVENSIEDKENYNIWMPPEDGSDLLMKVKFIGLWKLDSNKGVYKENRNIQQIIRLQRKVMQTFHS